MDIRRGNAIRATGKKKSIAGSKEGSLKSNGCAWVGAAVKIGGWGKTAKRSNTGQRCAERQREIGASFAALREHIQGIGALVAGVDVGRDGDGKSLIPDCVRAADGLNDPVKSGRAFKDYGIGFGG